VMFSFVDILLHPLSIIVISFLFFPNMLRKMQDGVTRAVFGKEKVSSTSAFYDIVDKNMDGEDVPMSSFKGSVLCIVNVASH